MAEPVHREITLYLFGDTHSLHHELEMPRASLYVCVGDFTMFSKPESSIHSFNAWLGERGAPLVLTPGNHESFLEPHPAKLSMLSNATV